MSTHAEPQGASGQKQCANPHASFASHALPHDPQFAASLFTSTHTPPQSVLPTGHWHVPLEQLIPPEHACPHDPQFAGSTATFVHPLPHRICPDGHMHAPPMQLSPETHARPHAPQFAGSALTSRHVPPQSIDVPVHTHARPLQVPVPQSCAHSPQLRGSFARSTHDAPQADVPLAHPTQRPAVQLWPSRHALPHAPQFAGSLVVSTHATPHIVCGAAHEGPVSITEGVSSIGASRSEVSVEGTNRSDASTAIVSAVETSLSLGRAGCGSAQAADNVANSANRITGSARRRRIDQESVAEVRGRCERFRRCPTDRALPSAARVRCSCRCTPVIERAAMV
jgi:hypothetical protein